MTVKELRELLQEFDGTDDDSLPVMFIYQEGYALQDTIEPGRVVKHSISGGNAQAIYLVSSGQLYEHPYGPPCLFRGCDGQHCEDE